MVLKLRLATNIACICAGLFLFSVGFGPIVAFGLYKNVTVGFELAFLLALSVFGLLGFLMVSVGIAAVARRKQLSIRIDDAGIWVPTRNVFQPGLRFIAKQDMMALSKHESLKGRLIQITLKAGETIFIQVRHYFDLDEFLTACKAHGLPVI